MSLLDNTAAVQGVIVAIENQANRYYGLQYHPEVKHTDQGMETLKHFLFGIAKLSADWKLENILEEELEKLRQQVSQPLQCCMSFWKLTGWLCQHFVHHHTMYHGCLIEGLCTPFDCMRYLVSMVSAAAPSLTAIAGRSMPKLCIALLYPITDTSLNSAYGSPPCCCQGQYDKSNPYTAV